jgi:hypothetical protein
VKDFVTIGLAPASILNGITPLFSALWKAAARSNQLHSNITGDNMTKRALAVCGLFCALFCVLLIGAAAVSAQKGANFSGAWELDKSKSQLPQRQADSIKSSTWVVTQDGSQITVEQKTEYAEGAGGPGGGRGRGMGGPITVKLDGSETTTDTGRGKTVSKAKWLNAGTLEITSVTSGEFNGNAFTRTSTEQFELADGGKTLKFLRKSEGRNGPQE